MTDTTILGRPLWYELLTTDMKAAEKFYSTVIGWTTSAFDGAPQPYDMFHREGGVPVGGVMTVPPGMNFPPHWEMYIGVPRLEETAAHIQRLGGSALSDIIVVPSVGRMQTMKDPQGGVFAIYEPAAEAAPGPEAQPEIGDAAWHELYTTDGPAALTFYTEVFKWTPIEPFDMGPMGKYYMFGRGWPFGGMMTKTADMAQVPTSWTIYFRVADLDGAVGRVKANGAQIVLGPMEVPGGDRVALGIDPQGAAFALYEKKA